MVPHYTNLIAIPIVVVESSAGLSVGVVVGSSVGSSVGLSVGVVVEVVVGGRLNYFSIQDTKSLYYKMYSWQYANSIGETDICSAQWKHQQASSRRSLRLPKL